jgi:flagellar hook-length control protein FliK
MPAIPAIQSAPQSNDAQSASPAASGSGDSNFKSMLHSEMNHPNTPGDAKDATPAKPEKTVKSPNAAEELLAAAKDKAGKKKEHKPDVTNTPFPLPPSPFLKDQHPASLDKRGKSKEADTLQGVSSPLSAKAQKHLIKAADFAQQSANILPHKTKSDHALSEKPVLAQSDKISENTLQAVPPQLNETKSAAKISVAAPVSSPAWGNEVGQKIVWMSQSDQHVAELHLNPPNLGPMEVKLTVNGDQATVQFVSQHHEVRAALESALPRLREMMQDNGISLGNATVDSGSYKQS